MTTGTADTATDARDTFPKLLAERARTSPGRPAYREKEYGIWQRSMAGAMSRPRSRLFAAGLADQGFRRGDRLIVIGDNRPLLYWSMCAAQALGGAGAGLPGLGSPRRWPTSSSMPERVSPCREPGAGRQGPSRSRRSRRGSKIMMYEDPRGLRHYDQKGCTRCRRQRRGAEREGQRRARLGCRGRPRAGRGRRHHALHLGHHGRPKGVVLTRQHRDLQPRPAPIRRPQATRQAARLPAHGLGRRPHLLLRPGW